MNIETAMTAYYAERAAEYERIYEKPERQADLALLRQRVESALSGKHVLEIACGTGYWTQVAARSAASIVATDINDEVLVIARSKQLAAQKIFFQRADAYALPQFPQAFNVGLAVFWWSHVPKSKLRDFLREFHRHFAVSGNVVVIDNCYVQDSSTPISRMDNEGNTYQLRTLDNGQSHEVLKNFPTEAELRDVLAGLAIDVDVEWLRYYWIMSYTPVG